MKIIEIFESISKTVYHSSSEQFDKFKQGPAWFSVNTKDANNWHKSGLLKGNIT
jgi:hypothetical protein